VDLHPIDFAVLGEVLEVIGELYISVTRAIYPLIWGEPYYRCSCIVERAFVVDQAASDLSVFDNPQRCVCVSHVMHQVHHGASASTPQLIVCKRSTIICFAPRAVESGLTSIDPHAGVARRNLVSDNHSQVASPLITGGEPDGQFLYVGAKTFSRWWHAFRCNDDAVAAAICETAPYVDPCRHFIIRHLPRRSASEPLADSHRA
jgi:hypothetical protein